MPDKIDLKRTVPSFRAKAGTWQDLEIPPLPYLAFDGHGSPDGPEFATAVATLYPVAYALKFASKADGRDYVVPPLEGLWWADDMSAFVTRDKSRWSWTLLLMTPAWIDEAAVGRAVESARAKAPDSPLDQVSLRTVEEGRCLQTLHLGPFEAEGPVLAELHGMVMPERGLDFGGHHHEIYLSDLRRTAPERLRTILRQPVRPL